jgi:hypothetical protein
MNHPPRIVLILLNSVLFQNFLAGDFKLGLYCGFGNDTWMIVSGVIIDNFIKKVQLCYFLGKVLFKHFIL